MIHRMLTIYHDDLLNLPKGVNWAAMKRSRYIILEQPSRRTLVAFVNMVKYNTKILQIIKLDRRIKAGDP